MQRIVANCTSVKWGYRKGDVLAIKRWGRMDCVYARNLTCPGRYGRNEALLCQHEFTYVDETVSNVSDESTPTNGWIVFGASLVGSFIGALIFEVFVR